MAGAIAHRFNNLLGVVLGNLEIAMLDLPAGANATKNLIEAIQAARRAAEVSGLMLTYLGQTRTKADALDLSETCRRSLPMLRAAIPKDVVLKADLPSHGPIISSELKPDTTTLNKHLHQCLGGCRFQPWRNSADR